MEEAADVLECLNQFNGMTLNTKTAFQILQEEQSQLPIVTMSERLDTILDGGIQLGKITEIAGIAGVGKTQLW